MKYNIHDAKTNFSKIVAAVESGKKVTICRKGNPVIECVPVEKIAPFPFGAWKGIKSPSENLDHMVGPTDDALLDEMGL